MRIDADSVEDYLSKLPDDRADAMSRLVQLFRDHLPVGFEERLQYGMPSFVVPHRTYPDGYHCDPSLPLPFVSVGNQKRHIGLYHSGLYAMPDLLEWFTSSWPAHVPTKLDMGKSCIRLKRMDTIPYALLQELAVRVTPEAWVDVYEANVKQ
ncbi:MAG: DUF1801 domain-containing protein [Bacteroidota bacterium]